LRFEISFFFFEAEPKTAKNGGGARLSRRPGNPGLGMHGEFLRLLFLQAHRETEVHLASHFTAAGMSLQTNNSEALRFKRAAFYNGLKSKVGLAAAKQQR